MDNNRGLDNHKIRLFFRFLDSYADDIFSVESIADCGQLLRDEQTRVVGSDFYDLLMLVDALRQDQTQGSQRFLKVCRQFVQKHSELEFIEFTKQFWSSPYRPGGKTHTLAMLLSSLLVDFYGPGAIVGVSPAGEVFRSGLLADVAGSIWDVALIVLVDKADFAVIRTRNENGEQRKLFSNKAKEQIKFELIRYPNAAESQYLLKSHKITAKQITDHIVTKVPSIFWKSLFCPFKSDAAKYVYSLKMERDLPGENKSLTLSAVSWICSKLPKDILKHRKFYVREKGVILRGARQWEQTNEIYLTEMHDEELDIHCIYAQVVAADSSFKRELVLPIEDFAVCLRYLLFEVDYISMLYIFWVLGIWPEILTAVAEDTYESEQVIKWLGQIDTELKSLDIRFETPYWWNNELASQEEGDLEPKKTKGGTRIEDMIAGGEAPLIKIGRYVRKLPAGQRASAGAKKLAARCRINLDQGYTLVDAFERGMPKVTKSTEDAAETDLFK